MYIIIDILIACFQMFLAKCTEYLKIFFPDFPVVMAYVTVPKDLTKVKSKVIFNLTKRQLICFGTAALVGIPTFFISKGLIGNSAAVIAMIGLMLPAFFAAMYEKDGMPAEKIFLNIVRAKFFYPPVRPYRTENFYHVIEMEGKLFEQNEKTKPAEKIFTARHKTNKKR